MLTFTSPEHLQPIIMSLFSGHSAHWSDWQDTINEKFLEITDEHGLVPILNYQDYKTGCCRDWPAAIRTRMAERARQETAIELTRLNDLKNILELMNENDIHPLLMKGTPLSYVLYPQPGLRPHGDTDLLIKKDDKNKVTALMKHAGYQPDFEISADYLSSQVTFYKHDNQDIKHAYDIHWKISNMISAFSHALSYEELFSHARAIPELGPNARTLNNIDALLLACFHRYAHLSHSGDCLIWLYDIHLLLEEMSEADLLEAINKANDFEMASIMADSYNTAHKWYKTDIPASLVSKISSSHNPGINTLHFTPGKSAGIKNRAVSAFKHLPSWRSRFQYVVEKLFPPVDYMIWRYNIKNKLMLPFYYLYRCAYGIYAVIRK